jgi:hypothetical protein
MNKTDIDSILLANWYFTKCKIENPKCNKTELARKYLVNKVNSVLNQRTELSKSFSFLDLILN